MSIRVLASLEDLEVETEGLELEVKKAQGRDGRGELPASFFESYSAMANTDGGTILLGVAEREDRTLEVVGLDDASKVEKALWDGVNNTQRVSENVLSTRSVEQLEVAGKRVLRVEVPRASRRQRPVHVGANPLQGTFKRSHEGDYRCAAEDVRRMLAERVEETRDERILVGYTLADLEARTLAKYRQHFRVSKPDHPWNDENDLEFLRLLGGYRRDRAAGEEGVTAAGMLMFGKLAEIQECFSFYMLDYQERAEEAVETRWVDRLTLDGSWSGNLYDFYHLVMPRLVRDLKVPFALRGDLRVDETPVHEALREALVNALVHADYTGRISLLVLKRPGAFVFRNPGLMRVPVDVAVRGGISDCRNRRVQTMFRFVNLGEQAGSGLPKVFASWRSQHWRAPELGESSTPSESTTFTLRMASLLSADTVAQLQGRFGAKFETASEVEKLALVTASTEGEVTHARLKSMCDAHARDVTVALAQLVQRGLLEKSGKQKQTIYFLPGDTPPVELPSLFDRPGRAGAPSLQGSDGSSQHSDWSSQHSDGSSQHSRPSLQRTEVSPPAGKLSGTSGSVDPPADAASVDRWAELERLAQPFREKRRLSPKAMEALLLRICTGTFVSIAELARLTGRTVDTLRNHVLKRLVADRKLLLRYPETPTHPYQGYTAAEGDR